MNGFLTWFMSTIGQHISPQLSVLIVSMIPLIEERGGLILSRLLEIPLWKGVFYCVLGNIIPIPFILFYIKKLLHWMADHHMAKIVEWAENKAAKNKASIEKYGFWGLAIFVGVPLPGTGAWSGSLIAALLDMDLKKASLSILIGVFIAAVIMTIVSYGALGAILG